LASVALAGGVRVTVIEAMPYDRILASTVAVRNSSIIAAGGATVLALFLAIIVARSLSRPLTQMAGAIQGFARGETATVPIVASGEIGMLARAFEQMRADVHAKTAALEHEIEERQRIFDMSLDLILVMDRKGVLLRVSPASVPILGYGPSEMVGRNVTEFVHRDDLARTRKEMRINRRGRGQLSFDCRYSHKDGQAVPLAWSGVWSEAEKMHFFFGHDMTERTKLALQLLHSQKMDAIGQLTGGVAHDFNNILMVIMTTMDILARQVADNPQLSASARVIQKATERGAELTQRLLAFARRQPLQPRETDINALIYETEKLLRPLLGVQIDIEVALSADVWRAMVDPNQLSMAIINLTVNARDAMPNGGKLTIETKNITLDGVYAAMHGEVTPGPYALISVSDSGTGIPAALIDKVFEPFFTTKGVGKGTGLGLSMVYGFVKQSGGHVNIDSKEGHGTTVKLYLPRASDADVTQTAAPSAAAAATAGKEASLAAEDGLLVTDVAMRGPRENAILPHERLDPGVRLLAKPYRGADLARMGRLSLQARGPPADQPAARSR
jgi:PAS domain S-box-containing protein